MIPLKTVIFEDYCYKAYKIVLIKPKRKWFSKKQLIAYWEIKGLHNWRNRWDTLCSYQSESEAIEDMKIIKKYVCDPIEYY